MSAPPPTLLKRPRPSASGFTRGLLLLSVKRTALRGINWDSQRLFPAGHDPSGIDKGVFVPDVSRQVDATLLIEAVTRPVHGLLAVGVHDLQPPRNHRDQDN